MANYPLFDISSPKIHLTQVAAPGAGNNFTWSPDAYSNAEVLGVYFSLTTDANVSDRIVRLYFNNGVSDCLLVPPNDIQTASSAVSYGFGAGYPVTNLANTTVVRSGPLPLRYIIPETWALKSNILNIQAGDSLSIIFITWLRYLSF